MSQTLSIRPYNIKKNMTQPLEEKKKQQHIISHSATSSSQETTKNKDPLLQTLLGFIWQMNQGHSL